MAPTGLTEETVLRFRLTVTDDKEATASDEVEVTVTVSQEIVFAQIVDGGGYAVTLAFLGDAGAPVTGTLELYQPDGSPWLLTINGVTASEFPVNIPLGGSAYLTTSGEGVDAVRGWASFQSDGRLEGLANYELRDVTGKLATAVAVLSGKAATQVTLPAANASELGVAIANPEDFPITVRLKLINESGVEVGSVLLFPPLGAKMQEAKFVNQLFGPVTLDNFDKGTLVIEVDGGGTFVAIGLILKEGILSALPVVVTQ